jgi:lysyl-tRNA synthetase class I
MWATLQELRQVRKALRDRQAVIADLGKAISEYRKISTDCDEYHQAVHNLNKAVERADRLL